MVRNWRTSVHAGDLCGHQVPWQGLRALRWLHLLRFSQSWRHQRRLRHQVQLRERRPLPGEDDGPHGGVDREDHGVPALRQAPDHRPRQAGHLRAGRQERRGLRLRRGPPGAAEAVLQLHPDQGDGHPLRLQHRLRLHERRAGALRSEDHRDGALRGSWLVHQRHPEGGLRRTQLGMARARGPEPHLRGGARRDHGPGQVGGQDRDREAPADLRRRRGRGRGPQHDPELAVLRVALRLAGHDRRELRLHPAIQGGPQGLREVHAHLRRPGPGGQEEGHRVFRGSNRLEVLRQFDGQRHQLLPGQGHLHSVHLRRGVFRDRGGPRPREGRHVGRAGVAADPGGQDGEGGQARHVPGRGRGALEGVWAQLLRSLRLRGG
mmetsp:Transcript_86690/g.226245  ORF Transcript_86690/g.226245 Transcript_86690/m.226245 type:complete len:377 (+) Transcript_86690:359-1489(+)